MAGDCAFGSIAGAAMVLSIIGFTVGAEELAPPLISDSRSICCYFCVS